MRVMEAASPGGPEVLQIAERPLPIPGLGEVRVRVHAAAVNPVDWKTRAGAGIASALPPVPWVLGWDVSGVVEAMGPGVTRLRVGDAVFGMPRFPALTGGYGEYVVAPARDFARLPPGLSHVEAAAMPLAGLTAWQALIELAAVTHGTRVLVHAAAGGVGHLAVQIARSRGAHVVGTASHAKHARLRAWGTDELVDYRAQRFEDVLEPVDVVLDMGGLYPERSLTVLRPGGLLITDPGVEPLSGERDGEVREMRIARLLVEPDRHQLDELAALHMSGVVRAYVHRTAALDDVAELHREGEAGGLTGKAVLDLSA